MPLSQSKKYLLDGEPTTSSEIIAAAAYINDRFNADWMKCTSDAARILRDNGQTVTDNPQPTK